VRKAVEGLEQVELFVSGDPLARGKSSSLRRGAAAPVLPGKQARCQWEVGHEPELEPLAGRQDVALRLAHEQVELVLHGREAGEPALVRDGVGLLDLLGGEVRRPDRAHAPGVHELVERLERLRDRGHTVGPVVPVDVDRVRAQPPQRVLERLADVVAGAPRALGVAHVHPELGPKHNSLPPALQDPPEKLLALSPAVDVGGVEEGDSLSECSVDDGARTLEIEASPEVVAP
jgi:hypothetical protein